MQSAASDLLASAMTVLKDHVPVALEQVGLPKPMTGRERDVRVPAWQVLLVYVAIAEHVLNRQPDTLVTLHYRRPLLLAKEALTEFQQSLPAKKKGR